MKKIIIYTLLFVFADKAFAQKDVAAKAILAQVSQKYKAYNSLKSEFTFTLDNQQAGIKQSQSGSIITHPKSNRFKITMLGKGGAADVEQEIISNGKKQWTYLKKEKEVQLSNVTTGSQSFNPAQIFTIYEKGYKYLYTGEQKAGGVIYQVIDLTPESSKNPFFKIRLTINKAKKQLYNILLFDSNGNKYNYTLRSFTPNVPITDNTFIFDLKAHPGVELVEL